MGYPSGLTCPEIRFLSCSPSQSSSPGNLQEPARLARTCPQGHCQGPQTWHSKNKPELILDKPKLIP
eukprot:3296950-Amphidinium_carterae.1